MAAEGRNPAQLAAITRTCPPFVKATAGIPRAVGHFTPDRDIAIREVSAPNLHWVIARHDCLQRSLVDVRGAARGAVEVLRHRAGEVSLLTEQVSGAGDNA